MWFDLPDQYVLLSVQMLIQHLQMKQLYVKALGSLKYNC